VQDHDVVRAVTNKIAGRFGGGAGMPGWFARNDIDCQQDVRACARAHRELRGVRDYYLAGLTGSLTPGQSEMFSSVSCTGISGGVMMITFLGG
jgi:hypothetical protein